MELVRLRSKHRGGTFDVESDYKLSLEYIFRAEGEESFLLV